MKKHGDGARLFQRRFSAELCIDALGCAIASAAAGKSVRLKTPDGLLKNAEFSVVIAAQDPTTLSTALAHLVAPLKNEQTNRHAAPTGI